MKELHERSGAKIFIRGKGAQKAPTVASHPDDDDELHVSIEGTSDAIEKALKEVEEILFNPEQANRLKQQQLHNLAEMNGNSSLANSILSAYGPNTGDDQLEMRIPNNLVGLVIGKGGESIQRLQMQTGAHLQIAKESDMKPGETLRLLTLKGTPDAILDLRRKIEEIINVATNPRGAQASTTQMKELDNSFILKVKVPNDKVGLVIGKMGMTVKGIQERTRSTVQIPVGPDEDDPEVRTLTIGAESKEAVEAAQMEIYLTINPQQQAAASMVRIIFYISSLHIIYMNMF
jgi:far upstream element-binding protein